MDKTQEASCEVLLQQAHERLNAISDQTSSWLWETDEHQVFNYFTDNVAMLTGISKTELIGTSRLEMALASDDPNWQSHAQDLLKHRPFKDFRYVRRSPAGENRHLIITGWPMFDETGNFKGYRGTASDETAAVLYGRRQVKKEESLLAEIESERSSREIVLENLNQSVMWFDQLGSIRLNNAQTPKLLGFSAQEYTGIHNLKQHLRLMAKRGDFGEVDIESEVDKRAARLCGDHAETLAYRIHLESTDRFLDVNLRPLPDGSRILTHTDVTTEARNDRELKEREAVMSTVINNVDQGILLMDGELNVQICNDKFAEMWGMDQSFFASPKTFDDIMNHNRHTGFYPIDGDDDTAWKEYVSERVAGVRSGETENVELVRGDGKTLIFSAARLPGGLRMTTYFDVTDLKQREADLEVMQHDLAQANELLEDRVEKRTMELRKTQDMLVKNERQALLGDLVSSLCHELRNPLNALNTSLYLIRKNVEGDFPKLTKAFDRSERTIKRCTNILTDLFDYALVEDLRKEPTTIAPWLLDTLELVQIPKSFNIVLDINNELPVCEIDPNQLASALVKIISNAAQAIADNHNPLSDPEIQIYAGDCGDKIELIISDNGPGMNKETFSRALEPLFSTRGFGVGLGLPISEQIIKRHHGELMLETQEGAGTTVTIWLPTPENKILKAA